MISILSIKYAVVSSALAMGIGYLPFNINAKYPHFITILRTLLSFIIIISSIISLLKSAKNLKEVKKFQMLFLMPYIFF